MGVYFGVHERENAQCNEVLRSIPQVKQSKIQARQGARAFSMGVYFGVHERENAQCNEVLRSRFFV